MLRAKMQPRYDRKLCLLKRTVQQDAQGFTNESWADVGELWAGRDRVTANEQYLALQTRGLQIERLRIRFRSCLESPTAPNDYRVQFNGRTYQIVSCVEDLKMPRRQGMILTIGFVDGQPTLTTADLPEAV